MYRRCDVVYADSARAKLRRFEVAVVVVIRVKVTLLARCDRGLPTRYSAEAEAPRIRKFRLRMQHRLSPISLVLYSYYLRREIFDSASKFYNRSWDRFAT